MENNTQRRKERIDRGIKVRTDGIYALMSIRELSYLTLPRLVLILGMLALPLLLPGMYWQRVITITCIYALLALSFDFLAHFVGLVSLGGAFFVGVGGYMAAILNTTFGLPPWLTVPLAALAGGGICTLLLLPCLPLRGVYFAIVSLMYPLFVARVIEALNILGGTDGITGIDSFTNRWAEQYFIIGILLLLLFGVRRLVNTDIGLVLRGVKDNDQAIRASGMNVTLYKAMAVYIASVMGCSERRLSGAYLYVVRDFPVCTRLFNSTHCRNRDRRRRNPCRTRAGLPDPGSHLRAFAGVRNPAHRFLCADSGRFYHFPKRRDHGLRTAQISTV